MDGARSALIVAINDYADPGLQVLRTPASDARALAAVLRDPGIGAFEVQTLVNEPSYVVNVAVEDFFADRRPGDLLLVHFACHGIKDEDGELHFATSNTVLGRLGATAVAAEFVSRRMSRSRSRRIVLLLDCCYAGAFERGLLARAANDMGIEQQFGGRGRAVITASSAMEYAFEAGELTETRPLGRSVFTNALVKGLETGEADRDQDGLVGLDELYDYVYDKVRETTPNQTPGKWTFGIEGELYIARRSRPVTSPAPLPPELEHAIESPLAGIRLGAVQELAAVLRGSHAGRALAARVALERLADDDSRAVAAAATAALGGEAPPAPAMATSAATSATPVVKAAPAPAEPSPVQAVAAPDEYEAPVSASDLEPSLREETSSSPSQYRRAGAPRPRFNARKRMLVSALLAVAAVLVAVAAFLNSRRPAPTPPSPPPGFQVLSMTFVPDSLASQGYEGFALGTVRCGSRRCIALLSSRGAAWRPLKGLARFVAHLGACRDGRQCVQQVRFATPLIGYAYDPLLLMTTNGGVLWRQIAPAPTTSLETADETVVGVASKGAGCSGQPYQVYSASIYVKKSWQALQPQPPLISTVCPPVLYRQLNRVVLVGYGNLAVGARATPHLDLSENDGNYWTKVPYSCGAGYLSAVALAKPNVLVLLCQQRLPESAGAARRAWVLISTDDGVMFGHRKFVPSPVGQLGGKINYQLAAATGSQLLVAETGTRGTELLLTHNGGVTWPRSRSLPGKGTVILVGFEDPSTGRVAQGNTVWTTTDGGVSWTPEHFKNS